MKKSGLKGLLGQHSGQATLRKLQKPSAERTEDDLRIMVPTELRT